MKTKKQLEAKLRKIKRQVDIRMVGTYLFRDQMTKIGLLKWILKSYSK